MFSHDTRNKIENITSGAIIEGQPDHCTAIRNSLCRGFATGFAVKKDFESNAIVKEKQVIFIEEYCNKYLFWYKGALDDSRYLTRGGEAKVYLHPDNRHVIKLNDAIYYATWLEFFNSILLHNVIFSNTSYVLLGFVKEEDALYAVLEQTFIFSDAQVELDEIKKILEFNGFKNNRRNDYIHGELGLILEDMHDENVIVNSETLFFIDSVFYAIPPLDSVTP